MPNPPSIDGISPSADSSPSEQTPTPTPRPRGRSLLFVVIGPYLLYFIWGIVLMSLLPHPRGALQPLVFIGVVVSMIAAIIFLGVGILGYLRIDATEVSTGVRRKALIILLVTVLPGLLMSIAVPFAITREPTLLVDIISPPGGRDLIAPVTVTFSVQQAADTLRLKGFHAIQYKWDINRDGKADNETVQPELTSIFDREGVYMISAVLVGSDGSVRSASRRFIVSQSVFTVTPNPPVIEKPTVFNLSHLVNGQNPVAEIQWDFNGDGKPDETTKSPQVTHTFFRLGRTTVAAVVRFANNTQVRYERSIEVGEPPPLPFPVQLITEPKHLIGPPEFMVFFRVESAEPIAYVRWDFGDGQRKEGTRAFNTFKANGSYPVTVQVHSQSGVVADLATVVQVVDPLQLPDLTFDPPLQSSGIVGQVPLEITLRPITSTPFIEFFWEAPDATQVGSDMGTLQAIYRREGKYAITLVAKNPDNRVLRLPISVTVKAPAPSLTFKMDPEVGVAPQEVKFDASESIFGNSPPTGFQWDFGDRSVSELSGGQHSHFYRNPGTYEVKLTVFTADGNEYHATRKLVLRAPILRALTYASKPCGPVGPRPFTVQFKNDSFPRSFTKISWDFGDGSQTDGVIGPQGWEGEDAFEPIHTYVRPGTFTVTMRIESDFGSAAEDTTQVIVCAVNDEQCLRDKCKIAPLSSP